MLKLFPRVIWAEGTAATVKKIQKKKVLYQFFFKLLPIFIITF